MFVQRDDPQAHTPPKPASRPRLLASPTEGRVQLTPEARPRAAAPASSPRRMPLREEAAAGGARG